MVNLHMIPVEEALARILAFVPLLEAVDTPILEALGMRGSFFVSPGKAGDDRQRNMTLDYVFSVGSAEIESANF